MAGIVRLGPVFWVFGLFLTLVLTLALVFLGIAPWDEIKVLFIVGWGGGLVATLAAARVGLAREGPFSPLVFPAILFGFLALLAVNVLIGAFFGLQSVNPAEGVLVNFLAAMYEEMFFLGIDSAAAAGQIPALGRLALNAAAFVPYHALRYDLGDIAFILLLLAGRIIFDTVRIATSNSDPSFALHGGWNVIASIFGGI